jgi:hypothetical protein
MLIIPALILKRQPETNNPAGAQGLFGGTAVLSSASVHLVPCCDQMLQAAPKNAPGGFLEMPCGEQLYSFLQGFFSKKPGIVE